MKKLTNLLLTITFVLLLASCSLFNAPADECQHEWIETKSLIGTVILDSNGDQAVGDYILVSRTCSKCGTKEDLEPVKPTLGLLYDDLGDNKVKVSIGECTDDVIYIPQTFNDKTVTMISSFANSKIKEVYIPETVDELDDGAFEGCHLLGSVSIPDGAKIGESCFSNCYALKTVKLPADITEIPTYCFSDCHNLQEIFPESKLDLVSTDAFEGCYFLLP